MNMTKKQKFTTLDILHHFQATGVPTHITCREAEVLCIQHGVFESKYAGYKNYNAYRRIDVAVYIAKNGGAL